MGKCYRHLTFHDRLLLRHLLNKERKSVKQIAKILSVDRSTIYREINRNQYETYVGNTTRKVKVYCHALAHQRYLKRRKRKLKIETNPRLKAYVRQRLIEGFSPWQIEWSLRYHDHNKVETNVTHETIYRYIYSHWAIQVKFHRYLRRKHVTRMKRGERYSKVEKSLLIQYRPDKINKREEFGHWEADLMMFVKGVKENFITLVERVTRFMIAIKHKTKSPSATAMSIIRQLTPIKAHVKSITFDQGTEFFQHEWIANCLDAKIYFCNPGSPHQKGSVENRNGVLRTIFPRNYPVNQLTHAHLDVEINRINTRPMRCLSYQTPKNLFNCHSTH